MCHYTTEEMRGMHLSNHDFVGEEAGGLARGGVPRGERTGGDLFLLRRRRQSDGYQNNLRECINVLSR